MGTKLDFLSQRASREPKQQFSNLMQYVNKETLRANFYQLGRRRAEGVDGVSWEGYEKELEKNLDDLVGRMKRMGYRPQVLRRVYIPKGKNQKRPLGIPAIEDKIVQKTMAGIMEAIYEQDFRDGSYGFRPKKSCHQALRKVSNLINDRPIHHVIEADIKGFFEHVGHDKLVAMISRRITDKRFLRYIVRFLKSGYMEEGQVKATDEGTPQGGNISPMLANIFLHYVLDEWFEKEVKPGLRGQSYLIRYCDDFVILMQYKTEAAEVLRRVRERFQANGLELNEEKTKVFSFGYFEKVNANRQGRRANTFDFLGFTHYCSKTVKGAFKVARKTSCKRLNRSCVAIRSWIKAVRNVQRLPGIWEQLTLKMRGHYQYYGVSDNWRSLRKFYEATLRALYYWLNRRSQKWSFSREEFAQYLKKYPLPRPRIVYSFYS